MATGPPCWCPPAAVVTAHVVAKEAAVICGRPWFDACVLALDPAAS
jgi:nicotinate-nucleotide pyrophosphorylase (carboxylating)